MEEERNGLISFDIDVYIRLYSPLLNRTRRSQSLSIQPVLEQTKQEAFRKEGRIIQVILTRG